MRFTLDLICFSIFCAKWQVFCWPSPKRSSQWATHFGVWLANCLWTLLLRESLLICDLSRLPFRCQRSRNGSTQSAPLDSGSQAERGRRSARLTEIKCCRKPEPIALAFSPAQQLANEISTFFLGSATRWNVVSLANTEALGSVEPEDIDAAWLK